MPQAERLGIEIGYEVKNAGVLKNVETELNNISKSAAEASGQFVKVASSLREVADRQKAFVTAAKAGSLAFQQNGRDIAFAGEATNKLIRQQQVLSDHNQKLSRSFVNANGALSGFNNIIRDSPFGIIGMGNNITQLVDAFGQLRQQTGSVSRALSATIGSIFSPAGLLTIGLSSAISLWTVYSQRQQQAASAAKKAAEDIRTVSKSLEEFNVDLRSANASAASEIQVLTQLFQAAKDETKSRQDRTNALKALQQASNGYLDSLTLETIGTKEAKKALDDFNNSLIASAIIRSNEKLIDDLAASYAKFAEQGEKGKKRLAEINAELQKLNDPTQRQALGLDPAEGFERTIALNKERNKLILETNAAIKEQNKAVDQIVASGTKIAELQAKIQPFTKEAASDREKEAKAAEKLRKELSKIQEIDLQTSADKINPGKRQDIFGLPKTQFQIPIEMQLVGVEEARQSLASQLRPINTELTKQVEKITIDTEALLQQGAARIVSGIATAVGGIIGGALTLKDGLNSIVIVMADFITQLGESLIAAGTATIAANALATNPATAIAAGFLAVAAGAAVRAALDKAPSFATGGTALGPQFALIGDNPARKEHILSDAQLDRIAGGGVREIRVVGEIRGQVIALANERALGTIGRVS